MRPRTFFSYFGVALLALIPLILARIEPIKSKLENSEPKSVIVISIKISMIILLVFCSLLILYVFSKLYEDGYADPKTVFEFVTLIVIFAFEIFIAQVFGDGTITLRFTPKIIPVLISSIIGLVGTFLLTCILIPNTTNRIKFQRQSVLHPLYNK